MACSSFEVAKGFVKVDVSKALPKEMNFSRNGEEFQVEFHYPWLPSRCAQCNKWRHGEKFCALKRKGKEKEVSVNSHSEEASEGKRFSLEKNLSMEDKKEVTGETSTNNKGSSEGGGNIEEDNNIRTERWSQVSPGKIGRSQTPPTQIETLQISGSKFSALSVNEEEEGEILEEMHDYEMNEIEINEKMEELEEDILEDNYLERSRSKEKSVQKRGRKKGQKAKPRDANPVGKRSSRLKKLNMVGVFWNVCGLNKLLKHSVVKEWVRNCDMEFGCVLETRVKERKA